MICIGLFQLLCFLVYRRRRINSHAMCVQARLSQLYEADSAFSERLDEDIQTQVLFKNKSVYLIVNWN